MQFYKTVHQLSNGDFVSLALDTDWNEAHIIQWNFKVAKDLTGSLGDETDVVDFGYLGDFVTSDGALYVCLTVEDSDISWEYDRWNLSFVQLKTGSFVTVDPLPWLLAATDTLSGIGVPDSALPHLSAGLNR